MENNGLIKNIMTKIAGAKEDRIAVSVYDGSQVTDIPYVQFAKDILKAAGYFVKNNISRQHVAIAGANSYDWIVTFFAISASGNTVILLNPDLPREILTQQCDFADASVICAEQSLMSEASDSNQLKWVSFDDLKQEEAMPVEMVCAQKPDDTLVMMFTSGTTGKSKAVEFSCENLQSFFDDMDGVLDPDYDRVLLVAPTHHIMGLATVITRVQRFHQICIGRGTRFMIADMPVLNPMFLQMVPSVLESIVKLLKRAKTPEDRQKYIGSSLKRISIGGAAVRLDLCRYMMELGIIVETGYGMTETSGAGTRCVWDEETLGSIGKPYGRTQLRIKDGELQMKGPAVMKGYYKDPEETAKVIEDGWIHTGDMGYCDEKGYYYITGRKKNVIILSNGENVNPEEIEAAFGKCQEILECVVYGDAKGICADVFTENQPAAAAYIKEYNESMPMYRQVYKVNYSTVPLEKTASGKIKRKENVYV